MLQRIAPLMRQKETLCVNSYRVLFGYIYMLIHT